MKYRLNHMLSTGIISVITIIINISAQPANAFQQPSKQVSAIAWSVDERNIAVGFSNGIIQLWDVSEKAIKHILLNHTQRISGLAWHPNSTQLLLTASLDGNINLWNAQSGELIRGFSNQGIVTAITWSSDGNQFVTASGSERQDILVWNVTTGEILARHNGGTLVQFAWSPDYQQLGVVQFPGSIDFADPNTFSLMIGNLLQPEGMHGELFINTLSWSLDSRYIATGGTQGIVRVWDVAERKLLFTLQGHDTTKHTLATSAIVSVAFSADSSQLYSVSTDGTFRAWNTETQQVLETSVIKAPNLAYDVAWSTYRGRVAVSGVNHASANTLSVQSFGDVFQIAVPLPSVQKLQTLTTLCVSNLSSRQKLIEQISTSQLTTFANNIQMLSDAIPPACAADLLAIAAALQGK
jgi:WD40 repeat protein